MFKIKKSNERGYGNHDWLESYHSFSFANYYNPEEMNFSDLRVINDDIIQPTYGFGTHPHKNMEIFSYVASGALTHKDTLGNEAVMKAGDIQFMSTGSGVQHSEFNGSYTEAVHLLQIWIVPNVANTKPTYQEKHFTQEDKRNKLKLIVSSDAREGSLKILQDTSVYASILEKGNELSYDIKDNRSIYIQVVSGAIDIGGYEITQGDAISIRFEDKISIKALSDSEFLLFDLR